MTLYFTFLSGMLAQKNPKTAAMWFVSSKLRYVQINIYQKYLPFLCNTFNQYVMGINRVIKFQHLYLNSMIVESKTGLLGSGL